MVVLFSCGCFSCRWYDSASFDCFVNSLRLSSILLNVTSFTYRSICTSSFNAHRGTFLSKLSCMYLLPLSVTVATSSVCRGLDLLTITLSEMLILVSMGFDLPYCTSVNPYSFDSFFPVREVMV